MSPVLCFFTSKEAMREADRSVRVTLQELHFGYSDIWRVPFQPWMSIAVSPVRETESTSNPRSPTILDLPNELILDIADYLSDLTAFLLRLTCLKFYTVLRDRTLPNQLEDSTRVLLQRMIHRDSFHRGCHLERERKLQASVSMCSACIRSHLRAAFTPEEMAKPPEVRVCRLTTGTVQLCSHKSIAFHELQNLEGSGSLSCPDPSHQCNEHDVPPHISVSKKDLIISWTSTLQVNDIPQLPCVVCPHIQLADLLQSLPSRKRLKFTCCAVKYCSTEIKLKRLLYPGRFQITVVRNLGPHEPNHQNWLAQLPGPSAEDSLGISAFGVR